MRQAGYAILAAFLIASCGHLPFPQCPRGLAPMRNIELILGRNISGGGFVSDADWARFVDTEVTPRFPNGLSVFDAQGQWRGPDGVLVREPSKMILIVVKDAKDDAAKVEAIRTAYKTRFKQQSVLLIEHRECVSF